MKVTISEDLADGQIAKLDRCLKLLREDDQELLLPSDDSKDDEIHITNTTLGAPPVTGAPHGESLQDYQMQLMRLEQQNRRRLVMARPEQEKSQEEKTTQEEEITGFAPAAAAREARRAMNRLSLEATNKKAQVQSATTQKLIQEFRSTQVKPDVTAMVANTDTVPVAKRQKRCHPLRAEMSRADNRDVINHDDADGTRAGWVGVSDHCFGPISFKS